VLRPRVTAAEQADRGAVALHDGVASGDDMPVADRHVLGLHHLSGVRGADLELGGQLLELVVGQVREEGEGAQGAPEVGGHGVVVRPWLGVGGVGVHPNGFLSQ
jgi:hypothetical protein